MSVITGCLLRRLVTAVLKACDQVSVWRRRGAVGWLLSAAAFLDIDNIYPDTATVGTFSHLNASRDH